MDYCDTYNKMYENGYRHKRKCAGRFFFDFSLFFLKKVHTILDVGCGWGELLPHITKLGKEATGIDAARKAVDDANKRGLNVKWGDICTLPFPDKHFDVCFSSDVIEHLEECDIEDALSELRRVSRKYIVVQIATGRTKHRWTHVVDVENIHMTTWRPEEWMEKMKSFEDWRIVFYGHSTHHVYFIMSRIE